MLHPTPHPPRPAPCSDTRPVWQPLPGSAGYRHRQAALDCALLARVAALLRQTAEEIKPVLETLYFKTAPLAVLECCATLDALAQEVEQDDTQTVTGRAQEPEETF